MKTNTYLVIGGTTGMGLSGAMALAREGHNVAIMGRSEKSLEEALFLLGNQAIGLAADACNPCSVQQLLDKAICKWGKLDGLYHVAGASGRSKGDGKLHELTDEGLDYTLDINFKSLVYSNRAAVRQFLEQGTGGTILNMASVLGISPSEAFFSAHIYAASKAAAIGFTRSIAATYAKKNIRANVVAPALTETPMAARAMTDDAILGFVQSKQPLDNGRAGKAEDLDSAVLFFLTNRSSFVTGQVLAVDGGWCVSDGQVCPQQPGKYGEGHRD